MIGELEHSPLEKCDEQREDFRTNLWEVNIACVVDAVTHGPTVRPINWARDILIVCIV